MGTPGKKKQQSFREDAKKQLEEAGAKADIEWAQQKRMVPSVAIGLESWKARISTGRNVRCPKQKGNMMNFGEIYFNLYTYTWNGEIGICVRLCMLWLVVVFFWVLTLISLLLKRFDDAFFLAIQTDGVKFGNSEMGGSWKLELLSSLWYRHEFFFLLLFYQAERYMVYNL